MKILVYSDHKWIEDSFPFLIKHISKAKGETVETIDRVPAPKDIEPFTKHPNPAWQGNGFLYPDWDWFYKEMTEPVEDEYDIVVWHEDRDTGRNLQKGARRKLNGVYDSNTVDRTFNCALFADKNEVDSKTKAHHKRFPNLTKFERVFLHEVSHGTSRYKGEDHTHYFDYTLHNIPDYFAVQDLTGYTTQRTLIGKLQRLLELITQLKSLETWHKPLDNMDTVSQPYGVKNSIYPKTGRHIGIDYAVPEGTRVYAPKDCKIKSGYSKVLGNYCEIETTYKGEKVWARYLHLQYKPIEKSYKRGDIMGLVGSTGEWSTGSHLHVDIRRVPKLSQANKSNWQDVFINPNNVWQK